MRTGPGNMPRFGPGTLTDQQVADIVAYVTGPIEKPANHGGLGLGGIGPVAEGFIALLIGVGGLMLVGLLARRPDAGMSDTDTSDTDHDARRLDTSDGTDTTRRTDRVRNTEVRLAGRRQPPALRQEPTACRRR